MTELRMNRRRLLVGGAAIGAAGAAVAAARHDGELGAPPQQFHGAMPWQEGAADFPPGASGAGYVFFTPAEAAFIEAAVARLIPNDAVGPGAMEAGVPTFIDRQLAGQYGHGLHFYLGGPWPKGTPEQGYQSRFTPAQLYRNTIPAIETYVGRNFRGASFHGLSAADQDKVLQGFESGSIQLDGADGQGFFTMLLQNTKEGYFSDPIYGGNRGMAAWKMIGFPGAHYDYREWIGRHGEPVPYPAVSFLGRPGWKKA
ncbi:MAG: Twin-arginine translocation pathway signal [Phenylobacterium sp.]|nr:Twin-arginine translocation pathway signal [Phenylobacterium sp.]